MIRIENISKSNSHRILFIEAAAALNKGEKIGLVGPNGAGKTTLFRMITGQEQPDEGQVSVEKNVSIGYFSQDVGEMEGRSAVTEVMDGAGPVSSVAAELRELEAAMVDPDRLDEMDAIIERYGEVQARYEELGGYALEGESLKFAQMGGTRMACMDQERMQLEQRYFDMLTRVARWKISGHVLELLDAAGTPIATFAAATPADTP